MLPSVVASELEQVAKDAIRTAFHPTTPGFAGLIDRFLADRERILKGPYVSVALPFHQGSGRDWFPQIPLPFPPYRHQEKAFDRLLPGTPRNTLVATGTGSGKTECFLLPLLEHCRLQHAQGQRGIKAILIYPMNALATDQARRIAQLIAETPSLAGLRAGLYIGSSDDAPTAAMSATSVITDKDALHKAPPDILLTNYKQLDYLLLQPHVQSLWEHNGQLPDGTSVLRYLVVDEFHTFDGAQGTDLACLIRRLRDRLHCPGDELVCVGTSATLGGPESRGAMRDYAGQIFASRFEPDSLIEEERLSPEEFFTVHTAFGEEGLFALPLPGLEALEALDPEHASSADAYIQKQAELWLGDTLPPAPGDDVADEGWRLELGLRLGTLPAVHNLVRQAATSCSIEELLVRFSRQLGLGDRFPMPYRVLLLESLLALLAHARRTTAKLDGTPVVVPWLNLRVQLWLRELKRMVASVEAEPQLLHSDDLAGKESGAHLPVVHCRDCGATAWSSTLLNQGSHRLDRAGNLRAFYKAYFSGQPEVRYLFPQRPFQPGALQPDASPEAASLKVLCADCLSIHAPKDLKEVCLNCQSRELLLVDMPDCGYLDENNHPRISRDCPYCNAQQGLLLVGTSAANLTSTWSAALFASAFNGDKKLLAFSDSVQDAAHRAGFIAARAYRTSFRTALTGTLQETGPLFLDQLQDQLISRWQQELPNPVDFAATFLPADLEWLRDWDALQHQDIPALDTDSFLVRTICERLRWEVAAEFGYRSRLGSSVEQAGSAAACVDPARIQALLAPLLSRLQNEVEPLRNARIPQVQQLVVGLLHQLRQRGAIAVHELVGLDDKGSEYLSSGAENTFKFNQILHTPKFGRSSTRPIFLTSHRGKGNFQQLVREKGRPTWSQHWLTRTLEASTPLDAEQQKEALNAVVAALTGAGLLQEFSGGRGERIWAIPRQVLLVTAQPQLVRCGCCGDGQSVLTEQLPVWDGMACLVRHCLGHYRLDPRSGLPLYRRLYERGEVHRIVAREHTGLLARPDRERLETQFIRGKYRSDPNLLSATSTLEMGINIGDLSTVLLASVPPEPANYLQRIGRAGRRDGNALVGTIVTGTAHDLYFFSDPNEMLQGLVSPPGCYLDAAAILKRQLLAYTIDRWVQSGIAAEALPRKLKPVLDAVEQAGKEAVIPEAFPYTWLRWCSTEQTALLDRFLGLFDEQLQEHSRQELRAYFLSSPDAGQAGAFAAPYARGLIGRLEELIAERKRLRSEATKLRERFNKLAAIPEQSLLDQQREDKDSIRREQIAYNQLRKDLDGRPLLAMLTDEGFLPNYAFPEAGVTLKSVLWRRLPARGGGPRRTEELPTLSYERPANVAIRELVPDGQFYAQGRRVKVDQIDPNLNKTERWRFCPSCSFACRETDDDYNRKECPRCGHSGYADHGQIKEMARLRQVQATTEDARSRFGDDTDERNPLFFHRELLILPDLARREISLAVDDEEFPFGAEYLASTTFREINFGELTPIGATHNIAGKGLRVRGFELCRSCGKVQRGPARASNHTWACTYRDKPDNAQLRNLLFMYREFNSEALRFLLPGASFWDEEGQPSFVGALHLGLRHRFGGKVDHLRSALGEEPQPGSQQRKTFLYLFDSVPGGTGYVRQLMEQGGKDLREVFQGSLAALQACPCSNGCYRCIFMYRQRFDRERTSKRRAIEQLQAILRRWGDLQATDRSLSEITINSRAESELELRFLEALRTGKGAPDGLPVVLKQDVIHGRIGYLLKIGSGQVANTWKVEQQVPLGEGEGVAEFSRADFLLTPTAGGKPIAIYTDGWEFHRGRLADDARQRMALQRSGRYLVWSLSWTDVVEKLPSAQTPLEPNGLAVGVVPAFATSPEKFTDRWWPEALLQSLPQPPLLMPREVQGANSLQLLMAYLANPSESLWQGLAQLFCLAQGSATALDGTEIKAAIADQALADHVDEWQGTEPGRRLGQFLAIAPGLSALNLLDQARHGSRHPAASLRIIHFDPEPASSDQQQQTAWQEWLRQGNLFQFLPHFLLSTPGWSGAEQTAAVDPPTVWVAGLAGASGGGAATASNPELQRQWDQALDLAEPASRSVLEKLRDLLLQEKIPFPDLGYELEGARGDVAGPMADLAWPQQRLALVLESGDQPAFEAAGWQCWLAEDPPDETASALIERLQSCPVPLPR
ncbi:DEAD/DEAH box helicase [Synechococcus sp. Cruz-9H2]|uniref:DEAD/DEAH box helicase n=1 Tax=unclassified Synechococcus TaxID=2626047 RepID=UPI0020CC93FF|nr:MULTISPECIES: DEAD/DEAH box helicase [unclassified Synechococcus]MCP9820013.1 DEAD/DEAH box helicase [Synechococcus sp. Cruz-9H2]MCP9844319.1 DEAD/DEAH box helicase [Synechococcus sp. Edmonson 11F2]MCP9856443.1 DEAD/DEAH box helicase [Synechococcus sp. Cruz-9C9]MCP9863782.1 DEAD/DEAH box helicase [Synechococcus sp. Cruz-7E5]MCP9870923.1 DEAD/DEAH box helicase [Synechococcus sp. Cruz-7B9]